MPYCPACGSEVRRAYEFCPECGRGLGADEYGEVTDPSKRREEAARPPDAGRGGSRTAYRATVAGALVWLVSTVVLFQLQPWNAPPGTVTGGDYVGLIALAAAITVFVGIYADVRSMDGKLWRWSARAWLLAAVLLGVLVIPLYVYKRRSAVSE